MINRPSLLSGGGEDPQPLTPQQRREWNMYVDYVAKRGYRGYPLLDKKETGLATSLFNEFKKENPNTTISLNNIASVQTEMQNLAKAAQAFEARRGNPNAANVMTGTSKIDSWPGSKTTSFKFPDMEQKMHQNSILTSHKNLGILNPQLKPTDSTGKAALSSKPTTLTGLKLEKMADGRYYYENRDGDLVLYNQ
jgi:hypothetical protein